MSSEKKMTNEEFMQMAEKLNLADEVLGESTTKYEVKPGQGKERVLFIDGNQSICPFTAPIPFSGSMGQVQIMRLPCNTLCPFARVQGDTYSTTCTGWQRTFILSKEEERSTPIIKI